MGKSNYVRVWFWYCCNCSTGPYKPETTEHCPMCFEHYCDTCNFRQEKVRNEGGSSGNYQWRSKDRLDLTDESLFWFLPDKSLNKNPGDVVRDLPSHQNFISSNNNNRLCDLHVQDNNFASPRTRPAGVPPASSTISAQRPEPQPAPAQSDTVTSPSVAPSDIWDHVNPPLPNSDDHRTATPSIFRISRLVFDALLEDWLSTVRERPSGSESRPGGSGPTGSSRGSSERRQDGTEKRQKRSRDESENGDDATTDVKRKRREDDGERLFACPFFKQNPQRHRVCAGLTLRRIGHVKQHIKRSTHYSPRCAICSRIFKDREERNEHQRRGECASGEDIPYDGITEAQFEALSKRVSRNATEVEQWYSIFYEIFPPDTPRPKTPYHEPDIVETPPEASRLQDFRRDVENMDVEAILRPWRGSSTWNQGDEDAIRRVFLPVLSTLLDSYMDSQPHGLQVASIDQQPSVIDSPASSAPVQDVEKDVEEEEPEQGYRKEDGDEDRNPGPQVRQLWSFEGLDSSEDVPETTLSRDFQDLGSILPPAEWDTVNIGVDEDPHDTSGVVPGVTGDAGQRHSSDSEFDSLSQFDHNFWDGSWDDFYTLP